MSGGSFNYVALKDLAEMIQDGDARNQLEYMSQYLRDVYGAEKAAAQTAHIAKRLREMRKEIQEMEETAIYLRRVWHAAEWYVSLDWTYEQFSEIIRQYNSSLEKGASNEEHADSHPGKREDGVGGDPTPPAGGTRPGIAEGAHSVDGQGSKPVEPADNVLPGVQEHRGVHEGGHDGS